VITQWGAVGLDQEIGEDRWTTLKAKDPKTYHSVELLAHYGWYVALAFYFGFIYYFTAILQRIDKAISLGRLPRVAQSCSVKVTHAGYEIGNNINDHYSAEGGE
jgi:hypothetical protein